MTLFRNHGGLHNSVSVAYMGESEDRKWIINTVDANAVEL